MSGKHRETKKSELFRTQVRALLANGLSISAIAKRTGASYQYTKLIAEQERQEVKS